MALCQIRANMWSLTNITAKKGLVTDLCIHGVLDKYHSKKGLVPNSRVHGVIDKYQRLYSVHWAETHFNWSCSLIHGSGQVCLGSSGSQLWPSEVNSGKPVFMSHALSFRVASSQALTLTRRDRFIALRLRRPFKEECQWGSRHFWNCLACMGYGPALGSHNKKGPCDILTHSTNIRDCIK